MLALAVPAVLAAAGVAACADRDRPGAIAAAAPARWPDPRVAAALSEAMTRAIQAADKAGDLARAEAMEALRARVAHVDDDAGLAPDAPLDVRFLDDDAAVIGGVLGRLDDDAAVAGALSGLATLDAPTVTVRGAHGGSGFPADQVGAQSDLIVAVLQSCLIGPARDTLDRATYPQAATVRMTWKADGTIDIVVLSVLAIEDCAEDRLRAVAAPAGSVFWLVAAIR